MAMITCKKCGKEFSDSAKACPYCDTDIRYSREFGIPYVDPNLKSLEEKSKGNMAIWKLISGIISCVLFLLVSMQSCAAGLVNTIEENGEIISVQIRLQKEMQQIEECRTQLAVCLGLDRKQITIQIGKEGRQE